MIVARPGEDIERLIARFEREVKGSGLIAELRKREFFKKPSLIRHEKAMSLKRKLYLNRLSKTQL